jgi:CheY-like chemotaxis protein
MKGETSCFNTRALIHYVRAKRPENLPLLWEPLKGKIADGEDPERFLSDPKNRVSIEICRDIMEQAKKATSDDMAVYKAALEQGRQREGSRTQQRWARAFSGPRHAIRKAQEMNGRLLGGTEIEIVSVSDTHALVRFHWSKDLPLTRDFCLFAKGIYQAIPTTFHLSPARLWERVCFFQGGPYCEYEMWWDKKPSPTISRLMPAFRKRVSRSPESRKGKGENQTSIPNEEATSLPESPPKKVIDQNQMVSPPASSDAQEKATHVMGTDQPITEKGPSQAPTTPQRPAAVISQLNNLFTGIQERLSLMLMDMDPRHSHFEHLKGIEEMIQQGTKLTKPLSGVPSESQDQIEVGHLKQKPRTKEQGWPREIMPAAETVLLVDDEDMLVDIGRQMLKALGYQVMVARTGGEAVEIYEKNRDRIDMVMLDMIMPDMGGAQVCDRMKEVNPDLKILVSSGYAIEGEAQRTLAKGCHGFIQKPFSLKQLSEKIRDILDSHS